MNLDLASTLVAAFGMLFMGIMVYFHDRKSASNALFFLISLATVFWSLANYFSLNVAPANILPWIRLVLFFAVPHAAMFALFIYNFPSRELKISPAGFRIVIAVTIITMMATVSPYVFSGANVIGNMVVPIVGPLMPLFGLVVFGFLLFGLTMIVSKYMKARDEERKQWRMMLVGVSASYFFLILTNFVLVIAMENTFFVKFGPLFMLPAIFGMGYAILRHHLLNVKAIASEILTFSILTISMLEVLAARGILELTLRIGVFCLFFLFGIFLIRSVLKEVEQREKLEMLTGQLRDANEKLKELDHLKSEFLSFASHQMKAPLAAIKGFATLIYDGTYGEVPEKAKDAAGKIKDSVDRMVQLVTDSLNVRKIEEGRMDYKFEKVNVAKMIEDIFEELKPLAGKKNLEFTIESHPGGGWVSADVQNIRQVFQNLIENSIKYTDTGFVKIKTESYAGQFTFSVTDSGRGIPKELLPHLFEEFKREEGTKKIEGTGLGLYIAHEITTAHKGEIWVESDGHGKGSKFIVKLPLV